MPVDGRNTLRNWVVAGAIGLGIAVGAIPAALASDRTDMRAEGAAGSVTRTTAVRISDLDLRDPAAAKRLDMRLKIAAGKVCDKASLWTLRPPADYVRCFDAALRDARAQIAQRTASNDSAPIMVSMR